jgi:general secretion pathway protein A
LLQIVLVGQVELEEKLNAAELRQFKQRIGIWRHLKPLAKQESREYIQHRLEVVGSSLEKIFTPEAVSLICQYARGIPRTINILCDNAFLIGYALSKKRVDGKIIKEVLDDMGVE